MGNWYSVASDIVKGSKENKKTEARSELGAVAGNTIHRGVEWEEEAQSLKQVTIPTRNSHLPMGFVFWFGFFFKSTNSIILEEFVTGVLGS